MTSDEFKQGMSEEYQGEVTGEVFFSGLLGRFADSQHRYRLATLLQLETETKARLRPVLLQLGVEVVESEDYRRQGHDFLKSCDGMDWQDLMTFLAEAVEPYVERYREIAELAPAEFKAIAESMVVHEMSIRTFARREASGDSDRSLEDVIEQLTFPMASGS